MEEEETLDEEKSQVSEYPEQDIDEEDFQEEDRYTDLLIEKYRTVLSFMDGIIMPDNYQIIIAQLNKQLGELTYTERTVEQDVLDKEAELYTQLSNFDARLMNFIEETWKPKREYTFRSELLQELFTDKEINDLKLTRNQLDDLLDAKLPEEEILSFKIQKLYSEWKALSPEKRLELEQLTGSRFPENKGDDAQFKSEKADFLIEISIFLNSYWEEYEKKEEKELLRVAKTVGLKPPPKQDKVKYDLFLRDITRYLEYGYVYRVGTTRAGGIYHKIDNPSKATQARELKKIRRELPIQLGETDLFFLGKINIYMELLDRLDKEHLIEYVMNTTRFKNKYNQPVNTERPVQIQAIIKEKTKPVFKQPNIYFEMSPENIKATLSAQQTLLEEVKRQQRLVKMKLPESVINLKTEQLVAPENITTQDNAKWTRLVSQIKTSLQDKRSNLIKSQVDLRKLHEIYSKYTQGDKTQQIKQILENIRLLTEASQRRSTKKQDTETIQEYYPQEFSTMKYPFIDKIKITELFNAVRRKYLPQNIFVELYDINELSYSTRTRYAGFKQKVIPTSIYKKLKLYLLTQIPDFKRLNRQATEQAVQEISNAMGIQIPKTTNVKVIVKTFKRYWPTTWNGEKVKDVYGKNVFERLFQASPFNFYSETVNNQYSNLVRRFTPVREEIDTWPQAMHDNTWYDVHFLDKNPVSGQPSLIYNTERVFNPKSKRYEYVNKISVRNGRTPYIKILLRTEQSGQMREVWKEVRPGQIKKRQK